MKKLILLISAIVALSYCSNNYSNGKRVGYLTQFSEAGIVWKSWEGHLNTTQTGMSSGTGFDFSIDNDKKDASFEVIENLKLALDSGYKVELTYNKCFGLNWFGNRGHTDFFVSKCKVLKENNRVLDK